MIIDFRVRPPYGGFLNSGIMKRWMDIAADPLDDLEKAARYRVLLIPGSGPPQVTGVKACRLWKTEGACPCS